MFVIMKTEADYDDSYSMPLFVTDDENKAKAKVQELTTALELKKRNYENMQAYIQSWHKANKAPVTVLPENPKKMLRKDKPTQAEMNAYHAAVKAAQQPFQDWSAAFMANADGYASSLGVTYSEANSYREGTSYEYEEVPRI